MKICSSDGSATSKWVTRAPAAIAAASTASGSTSASSSISARVDPRPEHPRARHAGQPRQPVVVHDGDPDHPPAGRALDVAERPAGDQPPAVDDRDRLAQRLDRLHLVGREDERPALVAQLEERLAQQRDVHRVEAR